MYYTLVVEFLEFDKISHQIDVLSLCCRMKKKLVVFINIDQQTKFVNICNKLI